LINTPGTIHASTTEHLVTTRLRRTNQSGSEQISLANSPAECRENLWPLLGGQIIVGEQMTPVTPLNPYIYSGGSVVNLGLNSYKLTLAAGGYLYADIAQ
jgi:hypothetical protein